MVKELREIRKGRNDQLDYVDQSENPLSLEIQRETTFSIDLYKVAIEKYDKTSNP